MALYPSKKKFDGSIATLLADGRIDVDGVTYGSPSAAAAAYTGQAKFGWWFFRVDKTGGRALREVLGEYVARFTVDGDEDSRDDADEVAS